MLKNPVFFSLSILVAVALLLSFSSVSMADSKTPASACEAKVHIVYTEKPQDQEPEDYHIKTLSSVLGSEEAARQALVYSYKHVSSGFSAKLTPHQVDELQKQPGVLQVVPSQTLQLHSGPGKMNL